LENRIGRKLKADDFRRSAKVNFVGQKSAKLRRRMRGLKPAKRLVETMTRDSRPLAASPALYYRLCLCQRRHWRGPRLWVAILGIRWTWKLTSLILLHDLP
jgi:hypothetical protein